MARKRQILVIGHNDNGCTEEHKRAAYEVGLRIAKSGCVMITGGMGGVMSAAGRGAKDANGLVIGIIPQENATAANPYCDVVIPTGMGLTRDFLNALSADGVVIVGGGSGTLSEICAAYMHKKPMVAIRNMGGATAAFIDGYIDHRKNVKIIGANTPKEAVDKILSLVTL